MSETIAAVYKTEAQAENAVQELLTAGVPQSAIDRHLQGGSYRAGSASLETRPAESKGFWASLFGGETHDDANVYDQNLTAGGAVVTVRGIAEAEYDHVAAILERHDPIDVDDHMARNGGAAATTTTTAAYGTTSGAYGTTSTATEPAALQPGTAQPLTTGASMDDAKLSLSEESLVVGKRVVNRGGTRIRRYVVETPVQEDVTLRDEKVTIERRPVAAGSVASDAAFTDKVVEMTETGEEAVVGKTARVVEEVALRKEAVDRVETVRDTVRKEEIKVEETPGSGLATDPLNKSAPRT